MQKDNSYPLGYSDRDYGYSSAQCRDALAVAYKGQDTKDKELKKHYAGLERMWSKQLDYAQNRSRIQ